MEALLSGAVTGNYNELSMLIQEKNQVSATILSIKDRLQIPLASFF
jgi:hypothetical protein